MSDFVICDVWACSKGAKVKVVDLYRASTRSVSKALRYSTHCQGITVLPAHPQFYLQVEWAVSAFAFPAAAVTPLPPQKDGRLSSTPWCEVFQAEIRTRNLPSANPALYHTQEGHGKCRWQSAQRQRKHWVLAVVRRSQKFSTRHRPPSRGITFTSLVKIDARNFELSG